MGCCERQGPCTQLGRQAGLQGRHVPLRLILSCQQTHDSWSHAGPGWAGRPCLLWAGPQVREGAAPACPPQRQGRRRWFLLLQKVGPFAVCLGEEADAACRPARSSADGRGPCLSPSWPPGPPLQTAPFLWSLRQKERKRWGGCEQKGLQREGEKEEGAFLFPFLRANKIKRTLRRPEHF